MTEPVLKITEDERELQKILKIQHDHEHANRIKFFGIRDEAKMADHAECCTLFRGPNPKQQQILDNWLSNRYQTYTMCGGNKLGKTTLGTVVALSLMFGYWPWDERREKISKTPIKIRYIGQDWDNHVKTVVQPCIEMWWPKERPLKTTKNNQGVKSMWTDEITGSTMELMSNKQDVDVFEGWDGHFIICDEPPKRDIWIACMRGLAVTNGSSLITATLLKEAWVDREIIKAKNEDGTPDGSIFNVHGEIYDNEGYGAYGGRD